jgi:hypothetical protein
MSVCTNKGPDLGVDHRGRCPWFSNSNLIQAFQKNPHMLNLKQKVPISLERRIFLGFCLEQVQIFGLVGHGSRILAFFWEM